VSHAERNNGNRSGRHLGNFGQLHMFSPTTNGLYPQLMDTKLHVIVAISNTKRFASRYRLYRNFVEYVSLQPNVILHTVEMAFGERDFVLSDVPNHIPVRGTHELWHKENLINIAASRLPADWKYMAWVDSDIEFVREDWALETLHQLQHYSVVQMFSHAIDLGPNFEPIGTYDGFVYSMERFGSYQGCANEYPKAVFHSGYAWAWRKEAFDGVGGMIDTAILGAGDHHMAFSLYNEAGRSLPGKIEAYAETIYLWQGRAQKAVNGNVGFMPGCLTHYWHGKKSDRRYKERWQILLDHNFDPKRDIVRDHQFLWALAGNKPKLRDDLRRYFSARNEDSVDL
jgi:hypothetical protein